MFTKDQMNAFLHSTGGLAGAITGVIVENTPKGPTPRLMVTLCRPDAPASPPDGFAAVKPCNPEWRQWLASAADYEPWQWQSDDRIPDEVVFFTDHEGAAEIMSAAQAYAEAANAKNVTGRGGATLH